MLKRGKNIHIFVQDDEASENNRFQKLPHQKNKTIETGPRSLPYQQHQTSSRPRSMQPTTCLTVWVDHLTTFPPAAHADVNIKVWPETEGTEGWDSIFQLKSDLN
jgi:hypothetical protein